MKNKFNFSGKLCRHASLSGAVLSFLVFSGCSTVQDIRETPPVARLHSAKSAEELAECIVNSWQSVSLIGGSVGGQIQKSGSSYSVIAPNAETPWHVADILPLVDGGSNVTYRYHRTWQSPNSKVVSAIKACAD